MKDAIYYISDILQLYSNTYWYTYIYIYVRIYFHNGTEKKERNRTYKTIQIDFHQTARFTTCNMYITTVYIASIQIDKPFFIQNTIGVHILHFWEYVNIVRINHVKKTMTNLTSPCGDSTKQQPVSGGLLGRLGFSARES